MVGGHVVVRSVRSPGDDFEGFSGAENGVYGEYAGPAIIVIADDGRRDGGPEIILA